MRIQEATCPACSWSNHAPFQKKKNDKEFRERETVLPGSKIFTDLGEVTWKEVQTNKDEYVALCFWRNKEENMSEAES